MRKDALLVRCGGCGHVVIIQSIPDCTRADQNEIDAAIANGCTTEVSTTKEARQCDFGCTCIKQPDVAEIKSGETSLFPALVMAF